MKHCAKVEVYDEHGFKLPNIRSSLAGHFLATGFATTRRHYPSFAINLKTTRESTSLDLFVYKLLCDPQGLNPKPLPLLSGDESYGNYGKCYDPALTPQSRTSPLISVFTV